jgi:hypothetical protein
MKYAILTAAIMASTLAAGQTKHAPSFEQCVADLNLWTSEIPGWPTGEIEQVRKGTKNLSVRQINERVDSLWDCALAHPRLTKSDPSTEVPLPLSIIELYHVEIRLRHDDFLVRHGLLKKFYAEDAAGLH